MSESTARRVGKASREERVTTTTDAKDAGSRGTRTKRRSKSSRKKSSPSQHRVDALVAATEPLLSLFAVCDAVFTEDDALDPAMRKVTLGRIYEEWQRTRKAFDPDFVAAEHRRPRTWTPPGRSKK